jgi:hypothetical protein
VCLIRVAVIFVRVRGAMTTPSLDILVRLTATYLLAHTQAECHVSARSTHWVRQRVKSWTSEHICCICCVLESLINTFLSNEAARESRCRLCRCTNARQYHRHAPMNPRPSITYTTPFLIKSWRKASQHVASLVSKLGSRAPRLEFEERTSRSLICEYCRASILAIMRR